MAGTHLARRNSSVEALAERRSDLDAAHVVASLSDGLDLLVDLFFNRVDRDVEQHFSMDSMLIPPSTAGEIQASMRAHRLVDVYVGVVAAEEARYRNYVDDDQWFRHWLYGLRSDTPADESMEKRAARYRELPEDERRLNFASSLERRLPNATKAPLVLYRLFPMAIRMVVAIAFGDNLRAGELRNQQAALLPIIADCHQCHGRPLDNGERCSTCSNPMWAYDWLTAAD